MPSEGLLKLLSDLEAHLNTSLITEKSVRKAQDKYLAEEIDKLVKVLAELQKQAKISKEGGEEASKYKAQMEASMNEIKAEVSKLQELN